MVTVNHCRSLQVPAGPDCPLVGDLRQEDKEELLPTISAATGRDGCQILQQLMGFTGREGVRVRVCV